MNQVVFTAQDRTGTGSVNAGRIRREGRIPAVIYGRSGPAIVIDLDAVEFTKGIKGISESTIVRIDVNGKSHEAFVKDTQRDILSGKILHVDFYKISQDTSVRTKVPIHLVGNPVGVREGGVLESPIHDVEVECLPRNLPENISVDISELKANQSIRLRDLKLGEGVKIISNPDQVIALVKFVKEVAPAPAEAAADATAAAAAATPAAATPAAAPGQAAPAAASAQKG